MNERTIEVRAEHEYYDEKKLNVFSGTAIAGSALINIGIIIYAVVCALMA